MNLNPILNPSTPKFKGLILKINIFQQTYTIRHIASGGEVTGYLDGEIFFVNVPIDFQRNGIALLLLHSADRFLKDNDRKISFNSPISEAGKRLINKFLKLKRSSFDLFHT